MFNHREGGEDSSYYWQLPLGIQRLKRQYKWTGSNFALHIKIYMYEVRQTGYREIGTDNQGKTIFNIESKLTSPN